MIDDFLGDATQRMTKSVDAGITWDPHVSNALAAGHSRVLIKAEKIMPIMQGHYVGNGEYVHNDFLKKRPLTLTIVRDTDGAVRTAWGVKVFPTSFVVDTEGRIRYSVQGDVEWMSKKIEAQIRELLPNT